MFKVYFSVLKTFADASEAPCWYSLPTILMTWATELLFAALHSAPGFSAELHVVSLSKSRCLLGESSWSGVSKDWVCPTRSGPLPQGMYVKFSKGSYSSPWLWSQEELSTSVPWCIGGTKCTINFLKISLQNCPWIPPNLIFFNVLRVGMVSKKSYYFFENLRIGLSSGSLWCWSIIAQYLS